MGIFRFIFSCITQAVKIAIGVALTIALFFAAGYVIDLFAAKKTVPPDDPRLKPYADRGMPLTGSPQKDKNKNDSLYLSFFETLINKKPDVMPEQPRQEKKPETAGAGRAAEGVKEAAVPPAEKPGLKPSPYQPPAKPPAPAVQAPAAAQQAPAAPGEALSYTLQLGSFQSSDVATQFANSLTAKGYEPTVSKIAVPDKGTVYRVRLGRYKNLEDAQKMAAELEKKEGISAFITSK
jgi:cell division protein FtsN